MMQLRRLGNRVNQNKESVGPNIGGIQTVPMPAIGTDSGTVYENPVVVHEMAQSTIHISIPNIE